MPEPVPSSTTVSPKSIFSWPRKTDPPADDFSSDAQKAVNDITLDLNYVVQCFQIFLGLGIMLIILGMWGRTADLWGTAGMWASACLVSGAAVGFLFGIPKILQSKTEAPPPAATGAGSAGKADPPPANPAGYAQRVNTNLEEISDWLTKIVVGLGLVNLGKIPAFLNTVAKWLAVDLAGKEGTPPKFFALAIILYFSTVGMLAGYLFTRLFLQRAFARADISVSSENGLFTTLLQGARLRISGRDQKAAAAAADALRMVDQSLETTLQPEEKDLLQRLVKLPPPVKIEEALPGFTRETYTQDLDATTLGQLKQLRALRGFALIKPVDSKHFLNGTQIEVTDFGRFVADRQQAG